MKNKNTGFKHLVLLFAFILCLFSCVSAKAANYYYEDGYKYTLSLGKATIISYVGSDTDLTVPSMENLLLKLNPLHLLITKTCVL